jgi:hypothetical protein
MTSRANVASEHLPLPPIRLDSVHELESSKILDLSQWVRKLAHV